MPLIEMPSLNGTAPSAPTFTVTSDGSELPASLTLLSAVTDRSVDRVPTATLEFRDGSVADQAFPASEDDALRPGATLEVAMGYRGEEEVVFRGEIIGQRLRVRPGNSRLELKLKHPVYRLTILRRNREFPDSTDGDALETILSEAGLAHDVPGGTTLSPDLVQHGCTDWDFLITRAQARGWATIVRDDTVELMVPELGTPVTTLLYGGNLLTFDAEMDARYHTGDYQATAPDTATAEALNEASGPTPGLPPVVDLPEVHGQSPRHYSYGSPVDAAELSDRVGAGARRSELGRIRGVAEVLGTAAIAVGDTVELAGLGQVFNGPAYVSGVRHDLTEQGWTTYLQLGVSPEWFTERHAISAPPAAGVMPAVSGLQIGRVVAIEDPEGEHRIRVVLPAIEHDGEGRWARLATLTAGDDSGTVFRPSIDEMVVLGFLDDDPRYPVILGSLHGSRYPAHLPPQEENYVRGIRTPGGHELSFDDDKQILRLTGMAGETITLNADEGFLELADANGNRIEMNSDGITIESAGDITLTATKDLTASAGSNCDLSGNSAFNASGGGSMELSSTGVTTVKGSLIQLN